MCNWFDVEIHWKFMATVLLFGAVSTLLLMEWPPVVLLSRQFGYKCCLARV